jgi:hypothetical protein
VPQLTQAGHVLIPNSAPRQRHQRAAAQNFGSPHPNHSDNSSSLSKKETCRALSIDLKNASRRSQGVGGLHFRHLFDLMTPGTRRSMISLERYTMNLKTDLSNRFDPAVSDL